MKNKIKSIVIWGSIFYTGISLPIFLLFISANSYFTNHKKDIWAEKMGSIIVSQLKSIEKEISGKGLSEGNMKAGRNPTISWMIDKKYIKEPKYENYNEKYQLDIEYRYDHDSESYRHLKLCNNTNDTGGENIMLAYKQGPRHDDISENTIKWIDEIVDASDGLYCGKFRIQEGIGYAYNISEK